MEEYDGIGTVCPNCGYTENSPYNNMYLAPGTVLHNRYLVGVLLSFNGEGATYIAYDTAIECKVLLREYMPLNLCSRAENSSAISVNYNYLAKYKSFMAEFTDLNKSLAKLRNNTSINPVLDMFSENNTTYIIFEYIEGCKLVDYLKENAGELTWEQVAKLFPPLFTTIGIIHNEGIIHRAISPDTVYVTSKGEIKLSGFCISSIRTIGGGLEPELFRGYAAPEQYSSNTSSRQGTWTDVYGISALLYRMLTGCMPTESVERLESDNLCEPYVLNPNVPKHVSRAVMDGLNVSGSNRIQTVTELVTRLFEPAVEEVKPYVNTMSYTKTVTKTVPVQNNLYNNNSNNSNTTRINQGYTESQTRIHSSYDNYSSKDKSYNNNNNNNNNYDFYDQDSETENQEEYEYEKVSTIDRFKIPIIIGILLLAILMILGITLMHILSPRSEIEEQSSSGEYASMEDNIIEATTTEPEEYYPQETQAEEELDAVVPDFTNKFFELTSSKYEGFITLEPEYEYNDDFDEGQIFWQELEAGSFFHMGDTMKVKVSRGSACADIPDYSSCSVSEYETYLQNAKIQNYEFVEDNSDEYASPDTVVRLEINGSTVYPGDSLDNSKEEKLTVYYKSEQIVTTQPYIESEPPETSETVTEPEEITTENQTETEPAAVTVEETQPAAETSEESSQEETVPPEESGGSENHDNDAE